MAELTEEQRQKRRRACPACRSGSRRTGSPKPGMSEQWDREGPGPRGKRTRLEGIVAAAACPSRMGSGPGRQGNLRLTPQERAGYESEESRFRELRDAAAIGGAPRTAQRCTADACPPPPMSPARFEKAMRLLSRSGSPIQASWMSGNSASHAITPHAGHNTARTELGAAGTSWTAQSVTRPEASSSHDSRARPWTRKSGRSWNENGWRPNCGSAEAKLVRQRSAAEKAQQAVDDLRTRLSVRHG